MLPSPSRRLNDGWRHTYSSSLRNHNAVNSRAFGGANDRAEILRIFYAIQHQDEGIGAVFVIQQVFQVDILFFRGYRDHSLVIGGLSQSRQLVARHGANGHTRGTTEGSNLLDSSIAAIRGDADVLKAATACRQGLF